jgi:hypothetical protein
MGEQASKNISIPVKIIKVTRTLALAGFRKENMFI